MDTKKSITLREFPEIQNIGKNIINEHYTLIYVEYNTLKDIYTSIFNTIMSFGTKNCNFGMKYCISKVPVKSYVFFLIDRDIKNMNAAEMFLKIDSEEIKIVAACLLCVKISTVFIFGEISSVCATQKDNVKIMLESLVKWNLGIDTFWTSIKSTNPRLLELGKLYVSLGFRNPYITNKTIAGDPLIESMLSLTHDVTDTDFSQKEKDIATIEQFANKDKFSIRHVKYTISPDILTQLRKFVDNYVYEYGGPLLVDRVVTEGKDTCKVNLILAKSKIIIGNDFLTEKQKNDDDMSNAFVTFISNPYELNGSYGYFASFHTHPKTSSIARNLYINPPSGQDLSASIFTYKYNNDVINIVVSNQGLYIYSLTPEMMYIVSYMNKDDISEFSKKLKEVLEKDYHNSFSDDHFKQLYKNSVITGYIGGFWEYTPVKKQYIDKAMEYINTLTIKKVCERFKEEEKVIQTLPLDQPDTKKCLEMYERIGADINTHIYTIKYYGWSDIKNGVSARVSYYPDINKPRETDGYPTTFPLKSEIPYVYKTREEYNRDSFIR